LFSAGTCEGSSEMRLEYFSLFLLSRLKSVTRLEGRGLFCVLIWLAVAAEFLIGIAPARAASVDLRVAIEDGVNQVTVGSSTQAVVKDGAGRPVGEIGAMNAFVAQSKKSMIAMDRWQAGQFWIEPTGGGYVFIGDRWYRGRTQLVPNGKGITAINHVNLEHYLYSVLGGEMNGNWPQEALKAQAVAARSYALYQRERAGNRAFDLGDTPAWQVYGGIVDESAGTQAAVNATAGQVLTFNGQIIEAVFHSSAGGCTDNVEEVWVQPLPYLRSVQDYDQGSPVFQWTKTFSRSELSKLIPGVGNILALQPEKTTKCGRIVSAQVIGDAGRRRMNGESLRTALGLRSTLFEVIPQTGPASTKGKSQLPTAFHINGRGFGHGLGMSQWGAHGLATRGATYQQILGHYYRGTTLAKIQVK
jgi:stage II sporulation protein D